MSVEKEYVFQKHLYYKITLLSFHSHKTHQLKFSAAMAITTQCDKNSEQHSTAEVFFPTDFNDHPHQALTVITWKEELLYKLRKIVCL